MRYEMAELNTRTELKLLNGTKLKLQFLTCMQVPGIHHTVHYDLNGTAMVLNRFRHNFLYYYHRAHGLGFWGL